MCFERRACVSGNRALSIGVCFDPLGYRSCPAYYSDQVNFCHLFCRFYSMPFSMPFSLHYLHYPLSPLSFLTS